MNEGVSDLFNGPIVIPTPKKLTWSSPNAANSVGRRGPRTRGFSPAGATNKNRTNLKEYSGQTPRSHLCRVQKKHSDYGSSRLK